MNSKVSRSKNKNNINNKYTSKSGSYKLQDDVDIYNDISLDRFEVHWLSSLYGLHYIGKVYIDVPVCDNNKTKNDMQQRYTRTLWGKKRQSA